MERLCHVATVDLGYDCVFSREGERTGVLGTSRPYILLYSLGAQPMTHATLSSGLAPYTLVVLRLLGALVWPTGGTPAKAPIARQTAEAGEGVTFLYQYQLFEIQLTYSYLFF